MQYHEFIGEVQNRARLGSTAEAVRATRATLEVLGERLYGGEADDLAAQLPSEIRNYLTDGDESQTFGLDEFFERVSENEGVDLPDAAHHARAVLARGEGGLELQHPVLDEDHRGLTGAGAAPPDT